MTETGRGHMTEAHGSGKKGMRWLPFLLVLSLCAALLGCQVEVYRGLTEAQVNTMLSTLLKRGIRAEKTAAGKAGFTLSVDEDQLVQSLEILKENNLPRADYENLGKVFSGQGMISSSSEEQARMAYAISQELSDTFSRIDGVLTARVHVVLGGTDQATDTRTLPSAAVFLRHTPDSPVVNLVAKIRALKTDHQFEVQCQIVENGSSLIDMRITVPTEKEAKAIVNNWNLKNQEIYASLLSQLL